MIMRYILSGYEPRLPLKYFEELSAIPRGSCNEKAAADWIESVARSLGLEVYHDEWNNVLVKKAGSPGCEDLPPVILQAHIDMVNEKNRDTDHDFSRDGLELYVDENRILHAKGTTLGADDGKGCGYMLALMDQDGDGFAHPPMEFLFTSGEEIGFRGALHFDFSRLSGKRLISLDGGGEGQITVASAGIQEITWSIPQDWEPAEGKAVKISVKGLKGGHSAGKITEELGNANKIMGRILHNIQKEVSFNLSCIDGGLMHNAIPREAEAVIVVQCDRCKAAAGKIFERVSAEIKEEYAAVEEGLFMSLEDAEAGTMVSGETTEKLVNCLFCIPNGVRMMDVRLPGLPVTSTNMGTVKTLDGRFTIHTMIRSSSRSLDADYADHMCTIAALCGVESAEVGPWLPAWPYMPDSRLRKDANALYREQTGRDMEQKAIHGGLEAGVFAGNIPGLDIITLGATSENVHTVTENLDLDSYARVYEYLKEFIRRMTMQNTSAPCL